MNEMKYCAILNNSISEVMWNYTLEGIRKQVDMAKYMGEWKIYEFQEIGNVRREHPDGGYFYAHK